MDPISDYTQVKQALTKNALYVRELHLEKTGVFDYVFPRTYQSLPQHSTTILHRNYSLDSAVFTKLRKLSFDIIVDEAIDPDRIALVMTMAFLKNTSLSALEIHDQLDWIQQSYGTGRGAQGQLHSNHFGLEEQLDFDYFEFLEQLDCG